MRGRRRHRMSDFTPGQIIAIETLDRNLLVKAGAGAGKTRVLVERYLHILATDAATVDGIAAITFTRKAAREMKERVRAKVRDRMNETEGTEDWLRWREVARKLDNAPISTIHSLCSRILREHPAEVGVDPDFGLMDEADETALLDEIWQEVLENAAKRDEGWLMRLLALYSPMQLRQNFRSLFETVLEAGLVGENLAASLWPPAPGGEEQARTGLKQAYLELFDFIPDSGKLTAAQAALSAIRAGWSDAEQQIDRAAEDPAALESLETALKGLRGTGELGPALRRRKKMAEDLRGAILDAKIAHLVPDLCEWFFRVEKAWAEAKRKRGVLTYDDLESGVEKLLRTYPEVCGKYNRRFRFLMVDECQDINERQQKIIYLLAGGHPDELCARTLFAVGDGKQSIYRFRGADSRVFARVEADVRRNGGQVIELLDNFRSHRELVGAFNDFFRELMPASVCEEDTGGADAVEYKNLLGDRGEDGEARVEMWVLDAGQLDGIDARDKEAEMIAARIRAMVSESSRGIQYKDVVVLLRAFTRVAAYEEAFARDGVPFYVVGGRGFSSTQEVMDALGLLRFLRNSQDEKALFGTLRSPFFQLSDEALVRLQRAGGIGGLWSGLELSASVKGLDEPERATALRARALLERLLGRRGFLSPDQLLMEAFAATGFDAFQLTQFMGIRRYANLMKLLELARSFAEKGGGGLDDFLRYVELRSGDEGEAEIDSETGNTVRIMTIHKSKGLEFPVVVVPDLQRRFISRAGMAVFLPGLGMGLKVPDAQGKMFESGRFRRIARQDTAMERAELKRVLYVAMTRAKRQIILSAVADNPKSEKPMNKSTGWLDWIRSVFGLTGPVGQWPDECNLGGTCVRICRPADEGAPDIAVTDGRGAPVSKARVDLPAGVLRNIGVIPAGIGRPKVLSPAYLAEYKSCPRRYYYSHICRVPEPVEVRERTESTDCAASSITAKQLGIAFHRFLELMEGKTGWQEPLAQAIQEKIPTPLWGDAGLELTQWAEKYLQGDLYSETSKVMQERREWSFQHLLLPEQDGLPRVWLSGQIDRLMFYSDGTLGIVDYKTDRVEAGALQKKAARYHLQIAGYALAAGAAFGRQVRDARLYFARSGETASLGILSGDLARARCELSDIADFIRKHGEETEYPCHTGHCPYCPFATVCLQV